MTFLPRSLLVTTYNALTAARVWVGDAMKAANNSLSTINRIFAATADEQKAHEPDLSLIENQVKLYATQPLVYKAVSTIARAGAAVQLNVFTLKGEGKKAEVNHPIEVLLRRPNPRQSGFTLMESTMGNIQLTGNAYWYLSSTAGGAPDQIYTLRPERMKIVPGSSADQPIKGYVYTINRVEIPLDPDQVIHFKRYNPTNDLYGLSPIVPAATEIKGDTFMSEWNTHYFGKDMAVPAGMVSIKNTISDTDFEAIQKQWQRSYGGTQRKTAFIRGADVTFQPIGTSHQDMDFLKGREFNRDLIMLVWGVPPGMLDKNATEANAQAGREVFINDTLYPAMVEIGDTLTVYLCPFFGDNLIVEPTDIRQTDRKQAMDESRAKADHTTANEQRAEDGNDPIVLMAPFNGKDINVADLPPAWALAILAGDVKPIPPAPIVSPPLPTAATPPGKVDQPSRTGQHEIAQFATFAGKRLWEDDFDAIKAVEDFNFLYAPIAYQMLARSYTDIAIDADDLRTMIAPLIATKANKPVKPRVSISGHKDPLAKEKDALAAKLKTKTADYLDGLKQQIIDRGETIPAPNSAFWTAQTQTLKDALQPTLTDGVLGMATALAAILNMQYGADIDPATAKTAVQQAVTMWANDVPQGIIDTTANGLQALSQRTADATPEDRATAIDQHYLLSADRAGVVAETEATGAGGVATKITAQGLAKSLGVPFLADDVAEPPIHVACRCWSVPNVIQDDDGDYTGVDRTWETANDDIVCPQCRPLNGLSFSEIAAQKSIKEFASDIKRYAPDQARDSKGRWTRGGGSYRSVLPRKGEEVHHMPSAYTSSLLPDNSPAIRMSAEDHAQTASYGTSRDARNYRTAQRSLIAQGKFKEAQQMDIDDVRTKFGDKYDKSIDQMQVYTNTLKISKRTGQPLNPTLAQIRKGKY